MVPDKFRHGSFATVRFGDKTGFSDLANGSEPNPCEKEF